MTQKKFIAVCCLLLFFALPVSASPSPLSPEMTKLVQLGSAKNRESPFFLQLAQLAQANQWPEKACFFKIDLVSGEVIHPTTQSAQAIPVDEGNDHFVVVVLDNLAFSVPGINSEQLLLLDSQGYLLDQMACAINSRYGNLATKQSSKNSSEFAISFLPNNGFAEIPWHNGFAKIPWHNWHMIAFHGKSYTFWEHEPRVFDFPPSGPGFCPQITLFSKPAIVDEKNPAEQESRLQMQYQPEGVQHPNVWTTKGLCRITIAYNKFAVIFPILGLDDSKRRDANYKNSVDDFFPYANAMAHKIQDSCSDQQLDSYSELFIVFKINPDGSIANLTLEHNGDVSQSVLDAVVENIKASAPFGSFPKGWTEAVDVKIVLNRAPNEKKE
jgi:hypothetical protein